jgi:ubiquinone biosynthesis protein COQ9
MADPTPLEAVRAQLAVAVGENAVFDGWTDKAVESSAAQLGVDPAVARLAFPRDQLGKIESYIAAVDQAMAAHFTPEVIDGLKIRDRIRELVWFRLQLMGPAREAIRSALAILSMPHNALTGLKAGWRSADAMWRLAGDNSTDFNHYTKRLTLSALYAATLLAWLDDQSEGWIETRAFLDRRIGDVMRFEKWKAEWRGSADRRPSFSRFLGRLRYPPH